MMNETKNAVEIRWLIRSDMPKVLKIESASFEYPWSEDDFMGQLIRRNCIGIVAEVNRRVVGYIIYDLDKGSLNVLNLAVDSQYTRQGIGSMIVDRMKAKLGQQRRTRITATVWERNLIGQQFFRSCGFRVVETVPMDLGDDGYVFQFDLA